MQKTKRTLLAIVLAVSMIPALAGQSVAESAPDPAYIEVTPLNVIEIDAWLTESCRNQQRSVGVALFGRPSVHRVDARFNGGPWVEIGRIDIRNHQGATHIWVPANTTVQFMAAGLVSRSVFTGTLCGLGPL